ncbi:MAG: TauD/TfdA family dioxygenase [Pseudomonadota bacterium]
MNIHPMSGALGAEVHDIDIAKGLNPDTRETLRAAFLRHHVLFFRRQTLSPPEQLEFARCFGEPDIYPFIQGMADHPEVIEIIKDPADTVNFGGSWHSDTAYMEQPALGTVLHALEVPPAGGDTLFANMAAAYDALSPGLKATLDTLTGEFSSDHGYQGGRAAGMAKIDGMKNAYNAASATYNATHPIVRTHPDTGTKSLYLSLGHTVRFSGMTAAESKPLLAYLHHHATRPEFTCRVRWAPGSVAVWDNRITRHYALNDYKGHRRHMRRVTLKGDRPR